MNPIKTIIIDDEPPALDLLRHYLKGYHQIEIVAECSDGFTGLKSVSELNPDLIFLDIQMPRLTGFEMLELLDERPEIIFTTAYDQYAIKAFELNAVDYLLKPFHEERLREAVDKALERIASAGTRQTTSGKSLARSMKYPSPLKRIVIKETSSVIIIPVDQVKYIEAQDDYVMIYHSSGKALKQQTMKFYEDNLPPSDFVRIHRSYIVKIEEIRSLEPYGKETHVAVLHTGDKLPVSRTGYKHLKEKLRF